MEATALGELRHEIRNKITLIEQMSADIALLHRHREIIKQELNNLLAKMCEIAEQQGVEIYKHRQEIMNVVKRSRGRPRKNNDGGLL